MKRRLFLAIPLPEQTKNKIREFYREQSPVLLPLLGKNQWVPLQNLHITVLFLGDILEKDICPLETRLRKECGAAAEFTLSFNNFAYAPPGNIYRMIWASYNVHSGFTALCNVVRSAVAYLPYLQLNLRLPLAHITLIRFNQLHAKELPTLQTLIALDDLEVRAIELWESQLRREGAVYSSLGAFSLAPSIAV
jgi:2'-5' RNA ligase